ncbi:MAG: oligopeptide ABC transporter ATP-binding protein, partial [Candidatus Latescibacteria bacterium]|nr:oligopeptide ABC transporter ATP-binding protein [bacterium]MBD3422857.1 oligopeptide ABC transporter ATP-binding protein [Candidatus Latescibacterota bacterium]
AILFVSHDLGVVKHISDRVAVMYLGKIVELADRERIFSTPLHPYTQGLLASIPKPVPGAPVGAAIRGEVPSPVNLPPGCPFHPRCPEAVDKCREKIPTLFELKEGRKVRCWRRI